LDKSSIVIEVRAYNTYTFPPDSPTVRAGKLAFNGGWDTNIAWDSRPAQDAPAWDFRGPACLG